MDDLRTINSVGDAPYPRVRSMLMKVQSPEQLRQIEIESPEICGEDGEVWLKFIKRDVPCWERKEYRPKDPISPGDWYRLYWALRTEAEREIKLDEEKLGAAMLRLKKESEKHRSKLVDPSEVPPMPKMGGMKLIKTPREKKGHSPIATKGQGLTSVGSRIKVQPGQILTMEEKERRLRVLTNPVRDTTASSIPKPPPPRGDQIRIIAPKRKQVETDESAPNPKRKRIEANGLSAQSQSVGKRHLPASEKVVGKENRSQASNKGKNTAGFSPRAPLSSVSQPRIIASKRKRAETDESGPTTKRKRVEGDESSAPPQSVGKERRPRALVKANKSSGSSNPTPLSYTDQPQPAVLAEKRKRGEDDESAENPKRNRVGPVESSAQALAVGPEHRPRASVRASKTAGSSPPTPPSKGDQPQPRVPAGKRTQVPGQRPKAKRGSTAGVRRFIFQ